MADFDITIKNDHRADFQQWLETEISAALEEVGMTAEGFAKAKCPTDTGRLKNSISHSVDDDAQAVFIGTNVEYAPYVEMGTGKYIAGGRTTPWRYKDEKGWHITSGTKPQPFLKPAATDHLDKYREVVANHMRKAARRREGQED